MSRTMSATQARVHFGEVLRRVENNETITVERGGEPKAVIISIEEYERLNTRNGKEDDWWDRVLETRRRFREEAGEQHIDVEDIIRTMREERSDQLFDNLH